ncbi:MAG: TfoX/Sxy family protein [Anaerolineae bacterium]|jgi:DNA transformation protein|nr:TfoX/Sxy family protein [Anaerolineae bacterium]
MPPSAPLKNIGPKTTSWLEAVGIHTLEDLEAVGVVEAYLRLKAAFPDRVSLNALWGLQGAVMEIPWNQIPEDIKQDILNQVNAAQQRGE